MKNSTSKNVAKRDYVNLIAVYLFAISPLLMSSFIFPQASFPYWSITVITGSFVSLIAILFITYSNIRNKTYSGNIIVIISALALGFFSILYAIKASVMPPFVLFGKGIFPISVALIMGFVPVIYIASIFKDKPKTILLAASLIAILLPVLYFIMVKLNFSATLANIFVYSILPVYSFGSIIEYPFWYAIACLIGISVGHYALIKKIELKPFKKVNLIVLVILTVLMLLWVGHNTLRFVAANYYMKATVAAQDTNLTDEQKLASAQDYLVKANKIAPFDIYYLGLADISFQRLQKLSQKDPAAQAEIQNLIINTQMAYNYDTTNNYALYYLFNAYKFVGLNEKALEVLREIAIRFPADEDIKKVLASFEAQYGKPAAVAPATTTIAPVSTSTKAK